MRDPALALLKDASCCISGRYCLLRLLQLGPNENPRRGRSSEAAFLGSYAGGFVCICLSAGDQPAGPAAAGAGFLQIVAVVAGADTQLAVAVAGVGTLLFAVVGDNSLANVGDSPGQDSLLVHVAVEDSQAAVVVVEGMLLAAAAAAAGPLRQLRPQFGQRVCPRAGRILSAYQHGQMSE